MWTRSYTVLLFCMTAVHGFLEKPLFDTLNDGITEDYVNCSPLSDQTPLDSLWKPQCDPVTNRLLPLQITADGFQFCVDVVSGETIFGPLQSTISCSCPSRAHAARMHEAKPMYIPHCSWKSGEFLPKQCNRAGECWCVDESGNALTRSWVTSRWNHVLSGFGVPNVSCVTLRKYAKA